MNENTHITKKRYACFRFNALFIFSIKDLPQTRQLNICHSAGLTSISNVIINSLPASVKPTINLGEKDALVFGTSKTNDSAPQIVNSRTMLPARFVAENPGANVSRDGEKELVTIKGKSLETNDDVTILILYRFEHCLCKQQKIKLDASAFVENDRTCTPVLFTPKNSEQT